MGMPMTQREACMSMLGFLLDYDGDDNANDADLLALMAEVTEEGGRPQADAKLDDV